MEEYMDDINERERIAEMRRFGVPVIETEEELIQALLRAEEEIENGRVRPAKEVFEEWGMQYDGI